MLREPPPAESIWAAGCAIVRRRPGGEAEYLLVHRPRYHDWTLPKGKLNKGESFLEGAIRETFEETGFTATNPRLVGTIAYQTMNGNPKVVRWWLGDADDGTFTPNEEVNKIKWVTFDKGQRKLTYRNDREVLDRANDLHLAKSAGIIYLVRHGWAGRRAEGDPDDWKRSLDDRGLAQRRAIRRMLQAHPITRIGSSDYKRCVSTVKPLSKRLGIPVEFEPCLVEGSDPERLEALMHELQGEAAVLCSHGDIIKNTIGTLFAEDLPMDGPKKWQRGSIWELRTIKGRVVGGRYVAPPA